ncbi:MAG: HAMP domain-containing protein [Phycisphaerales bacterium]|nr:HAMP domain-containing protein [Phycisphaerales bacterium]
MTIRVKLTMMFIAVILVANSILSLATVHYVSRVWLHEVQNNVRLDLNSARVIYDHHIERSAHFLLAVALDQSLAEALEKKDCDELGRILRRVYSSWEMDFVVVLDASGVVICRARAPERTGDMLVDNPLIAQVMETQQAATGTIVLTDEQLAVEDGELAARARIELIASTPAELVPDSVSTYGLVAAAAVPITDHQGHLLGILYGGDLLNGRYDVVDAIQSMVFPPQSHQGQEKGTITIFLDDTRISTNVTLPSGQRAVGTRMSEPVRDAVLERGELWAAPAFVVNDWYISAYEPIRDPRGRTIGALYVGLLQEPFLHKRNIIAGSFLAFMGLATLVSLSLIFLVTKLVLRPIDRIIAMSRKMSGGDFSVRVGMHPPGEMGQLCQAIDSMADAVAQREERLTQAARQQIGRSEKLASIGRLAAGIAHEINNPLTGVLTFAHLLHGKANMDAQDREDLELIINETSRVAEIVSGLLDFAREKPVKKEPLDVNDAIRRTIRLIGGQKQFQEILISEELCEGLPVVRGDMNQFQQVLLNLFLNACEAMPNGGTLTLRTTQRDRLVVIQVADTGHGIRREHLDQIFEPFFSTKPVGKSTGLGLSVSYGIIEQHGGSLEVESAEGNGAVFTIILPAADNQPGQAERPEKDKAES